MDTSINQQHAAANTANLPGPATRGYALVTGASSGIGKEVARQLLGAGLIVYVGSRVLGLAVGRRAADMEWRGAQAKAADHDTILVWPLPTP